VTTGEDTGGRGPLACAAVFGDRDAVVREVRPWDVHGVPYVDVTVSYEDGSSEVARLGVESVPADLAVGDRVAVSRAVNMIVSIRRA
jgi:hypothetical protein